MVLSGFCLVDADVALYKELWRACAGPLVTVPRENELVFYFPQGHIEQVQICINFCFFYRFLLFLALICEAAVLILPLFTEKLSLICVN